MASLLPLGLGEPGFPAVADVEGEERARGRESATRAVMEASGECHAHATEPVWDRAEPTDSREPHSQAPGSNHGPLHCIHSARRMRSGLGAPLESVFPGDAHSTGPGTQFENHQANRFPVGGN